MKSSPRVNCEEFTTRVFAEILRNFLCSEQRKKLLKAADVFWETGGLKNLGQFTSETFKKEFKFLKIFDFPKNVKSAFL